MTLRLKLITTRAKLGDCLLREEFFESPLFDVLSLVLLELRDELDCAGKDTTLVLFAAWDDLGELVDAFVDGLTSSAFDCIMSAIVYRHD